MAKWYQDDVGNTSSMRCLSAIIIVVVVAVWTYCSLKNGHIEPLTEGHGIVAIALFGGNAGHKFAEKKNKS